MTNIRGLTFTGAVEYVRNNFGEEGLNKVLESLPEEERKVAGSKFHTMEWYSLGIFVNFLTAADKVLGKGDCNICREAGKLSAAEAFGGIYKIFLEFGGPQIFLKKAALAWRALNDSGYLEIVMAQEHRTIGRVKEYGYPHKSYCCFLSGYFEKVLELSGGKDVKVTETKCVCDGNEYCEYEAVWE